ncbi:MAG: hypothetical protein JSV92_03090 [archaeon]|nr:MAG: hypothetical protein JSV92_03090 [archaeon]
MRKEVEKGVKETLNKRKILYGYKRVKKALKGGKAKNILIKGMTRGDNSQ